MYGEILDFQRQHQHRNVKYPSGKSIFVVNLPLKIFHFVDFCIDSFWFKVWTNNIPIIWHHIDVFLMDISL